MRNFRPSWIGTGSGVPFERSGPGGDPAPHRPGTQLGYATQLVTVRAIGTFQSDPAAVPEPVVAAQRPAATTPVTPPGSWPPSDSAQHDQNGRHTTMPEPWRDR